MVGTGRLLGLLRGWDWHVEGWVPGGSGREGRCPVSPSTRNGPWKNGPLNCRSSGVRGWGPGPRVPKEKRSLTEEAGQDPHVCRVQGKDGARGEDQKRAGGSSHWREGGKRLLKRPGPRRSRQELDALPGARKAAEEAAGDRRGAGRGLASG